MNKALFLKLSLFLLTCCWGEQELSKKQMLGSLEIIGNHFQLLYSPIAWKEEHHGWSLDVAMADAKREVEQMCPLSLKDYQRAVKKFLQSTHDYHVSVSFLSTESASLPFSLRRAEGRYFISSINRSKLSSSLFPFHVGDELLEFGGRPVEEVVRELYASDFTVSHPDTDIALATYALTSRLGSRGHIVPRGPVMLKIAQKDVLKPRTVQLIWSYDKEMIPAPKMNCTQFWKLFLKKRSLCEESLFNRQYAVDFPLCKDEPTKLGALKGFLPLLGKKLWSAPHNPYYDAYIFEHASGPVGYLRIPHYVHPDEAVDVFESLIDHMNGQTVALVIDQTHNSGGNYFQMIALASMLTDQALIAPLESIKITQKDILVASEWLPDVEAIQNDHDAQEVIGPSFFGIPVTYTMAQFFAEYFRFILKQWDEGKTTTDPVWFYGVNAINPHPRTRYTKPVVMLIDELDFSCADFLPAILQDNARATLFGTCTAGAGGARETFSIRNLFAFDSFTLTITLAKRPNNTTIEDLGVHPDVPYALTPQDLANGYHGYIHALHNVLTDLIPASAEIPQVTAVDKIPEETDRPKGENIHQAFSPKPQRAE